jgi:hypothetical protein
LNGYPITYTVPANSTLNTVATGLAALINAATNATQVKAMKNLIIEFIENLPLLN